jgi:hypothetical protein
MGTNNSAVSYVRAYTIVMPVQIQIKGIPNCVKIIGADKVEEGDKELVIKHGNETVGKFDKSEIVGWWIAGQ